MFGLAELEGWRLHTAITVTASLSFCVFGYDQGVLGGLITIPKFLGALGNPDSTLQGLIAAIYNIGCMIGCVVAAIYGLRLGRRRSMMIGCLFIVVGGAGQAATYSAAQIMVFRVITGIGTGITSSTVPVWVSEISAPKKRGQNVAMQLTIVLSGNVMAYWIDYGMSFVTSDASFRFPLALQCLPPMIALMLSFDLPETPRVLYYWGRIEEADRVLCRLNGVNGLCDSHPATAAEKASILEGIRFENALTDETPLWRSLFWDNSPTRNSRRLFIVVVMQALQQLGGCNVITYYQSIIFEESIGLTNNTARLVSGFSALCFFSGTLPAMYLIEKLGRRKLLMFGSVGCCISMLIFTVILATSDGGAAAGWGAAAMIFLFEFIFGATWNCTVWVYAPEISPLKFRHINSSLAVMSEWAFTFLTVMMAPPAITNTHWRIYILFVIFTALQVPFVYFMCPETAGRTLEELDIAFASGLSATNHIDSAHEEVVTPQYKEKTESS